MFINSLWSTALFIWGSLTKHLRRLNQFSKHSYVILSQFYWKQYWGSGRQFSQGFIGSVRNRALGLDSKYSWHSHPMVEHWMQESPLHHWTSLLLPKRLPVAMATAVQLPGPDLPLLHQCKSWANSLKVMEPPQISVAKGGYRADLVPLNLI